MLFTKLEYPKGAVQRVSRAEVYSRKRKESSLLGQGKKENNSKHSEWLQDFHADCIPIEGRDDLVVLIVSRNEQVTHTEVLAATEDTEATLPQLRPMPYGQYRTSIEDIRPTKKAEQPDLDDTEDDSLQMLQKQE